MSKEEDDNKAPPPAYDAGPEQTALLLVERHSCSAPKFEIRHLVFSPLGDVLAASMVNRLDVEDLNGIRLWESQALKELGMRGPNAFHPNFSALSGFTTIAFAPKPHTAFAVGYGGMASSTSVSRLDHISHARIDVYDYLSRKRITGHGRTTVAAPLAWSPDGESIAGVVIKDPNRVVLLSASNVAVKYVFAMHMSEVTHVAFTPDGRSVITMGKDRWIRVTSATSWKTFGRLEVETKYDPSLMAVAPQGNAVVSVWGRDVRIWNIEKGTMTGYNLDQVRETEGWPLCISIDCKYLACRTERGFDISEVETGKFLGEVTKEVSFITSAAFSPDGRSIAVGKYNGTVQLFDMVTGVQ